MRMTAANSINNAFKELERAISMIKEMEREHEEIQGIYLDNYDKMSEEERRDYKTRIGILEHFLRML